MKVKVEFTIETADYGEREFKEEIETLIKDIDPNAELVDFIMKEAN